MPPLPKAARPSAPSRRCARALAALLAWGAAAGTLAQAPATTPGKRARTAPDPHPQETVRANNGGEKEQAVEDILPLSDLADDPIGLDPGARALSAPSPAVVRNNRGIGTSGARGTGPDADTYGPSPGPYRARVGRALTAVAPVRETRHMVTTAFADGRASVGIEQRFESTSDKPAEVRYRISLARGARLADLQVCNPVGCRRGQLARGSEVDAYDAVVHARGPSAPIPPAARVRIVATRNGPVLELHAAPVSKAMPLTTSIGFSAPAPLHAGMVRLELPARGMDPRAAPGHYGMIADGLLDPRIDGLVVTPIARAKQPPRKHAPATPASLPTGTWVERDPWVGVQLSARMERGGPPRLSAVHFRCGGGPDRCARLRAAAGPRQHDPADVILAVDVSPSMEGPARNRLASAIAGLLAAAPTGTRVRALVFAGRAQVLMADPQPPDRVPLAPFTRAARTAELGSATRAESAVSRALTLWKKERARGPSGKRMRRLLVLVGDGGITTAEDPTDRTAETSTRRDQKKKRERNAALKASARAGVEVAVVNLADRATRPALRAIALRTGGALVEAGPEAASATRGNPGAPLEEQLDAVFAPVVSPRLTTRGAGGVKLPGLRAGHEVVWEGPIRGSHASLRAGGRTITSRSLADTVGPGDATDTQPSALLAVDGRDLGRRQTDWPRAPAIQPTRRNGRPKACDRRGPARRLSGLSSDIHPVQLATPRRCRPKPKDGQARKPELGKGMPAGPLLDMLRQRIIPVARGCFRRDRAGRPDHARRAVFKFRLSEREIVSARVEGPIPEPLRKCLIQAVDQLLVPRFNGTVIVSYPLRTEREAPPEQIELTSETAKTVDSLLTR